MGKKAVVAGATGMVGRELVDMLLRDERFGEVTVLVRSHMEIQHPKLTQIVVDFDRLDELSPDIVGHAVVFCALGTTIKKAKTQENFRRVDYGYPFVLGQLAKLHGADGMLVVTAMGANPKSGIFYNRVKGELEDDLRRLDLPYLRIFRPSLLLGERQEHRTGEKIAMMAAKWLPGFIFGKYKPIAGRTVAQAMVNAAVGNDAVSSEIIMSNEIARLAAALSN